MSGTKAGGQKAAKTNMERHGKDYYARMGSKGGSAPHFSPRGFAANPKLAREAGKIGGLISRRTGVANGEGKTKPKAKKPVKKETVKEEPKKKGLFDKIFGSKND